MNRLLSGDRLDCRKIAEDVKTAQYECCHCLQPFQGVRNGVCRQITGLKPVWSIELSQLVFPVMFFWKYFEES